LAVTGGFAGVDRKLELDQTGAYQAIDRQLKITLPGSFPPDMVADVAQRLPAVCVASGATRPPACADCFTYSLQANLESGHYELALNDANLAQAPAGELIGFLSRLLSSTLDR
jgi:hypothetical protein